MLRFFVLLVALIYGCFCKKMFYVLIELLIVVDVDSTYSLFHAMLNYLL